MALRDVNYNIGGETTSEDSSDEQESQKQRGPGKSYQWTDPSVTDQVCFELTHPIVRRYSFTGELGEGSNLHHS